MVLPSLFSLPMPLYTSWGFCWDWPESWDPSGPQAAPIDSLRSLRVPRSLHADALPLASRPQVRDVKPAGGPCQLPPRLPRFVTGCQDRPCTAFPSRSRARLHPPLPPIRMYVGIPTPSLLRALRILRLLLAGSVLTVGSSFCGAGRRICPLSSSLP